MIEAQRAAAFGDQRKRLICRHMNLLSPCVSREASPKSAQISEIARRATSRDVVQCGFDVRRGFGFAEGGPWQGVPKNCRLRRGLLNTTLTCWSSAAGRRAHGQPSAQPSM